MYNQSVSFELQIKFIKYIQWLLEAGSYTSTYKFALLISLVNACIESGVSDNQKFYVTYEQLAEHFIKLYWSQSLPYSNEQVLLQGSGKQSAVISGVIKLQSKEQNINKASLKYPTEWLKLHKLVAKTIHKYPADLLQSPEKIQRTFLYKYDINDKKGLWLEQGIAYCFANYGAITIKLCQQYWTDFIRRLNKNQSLFIQEIELKTFLFTNTRQNLTSLVPLLIELQQGKCFYCHKPMKNKKEVDHFIPWSKYANDTAHNFVLADHRCNNNKRDYLADVPFYKSWLERNELFDKQIYDYCITQGFVSNRNKSEKVGAWAYNLAVENEDIIWQPAEPSKKIILKSDLELFLI